MQTTTGTWEADESDWVDVEITDRFILDTTLEEISETIRLYKSFPRIIKWILGKDLQRNVARLEAEVIICKDIKI